MGSLNPKASHGARWRPCRLAHHPAKPLWRQPFPCAQIDRATPTNVQKAKQTNLLRMQHDDLIAVRNEHGRSAADEQPVSNDSRDALQLPGYVRGI